LHLISEKPWNSTIECKKRISIYLWIYPKSHRVLGNDTIWHTSANAQGSSRHNANWYTLLQHTATQIVSSCVVCPLSPHPFTLIKVIYEHEHKRQTQAYAKLFAWL